MRTENIASEVDMICNRGLGLDILKKKLTGRLSIFEYSYSLFEESRFCSKNLKLQWQVERYCSRPLTSFEDCVLFWAASEIVRGGERDSLGLDDESSGSLPRPSKSPEACSKRDRALLTTTQSCSCARPRD